MTKRRDRRRRAVTGGRDELRYGVLAYVSGREDARQRRAHEGIRHDVSWRVEVHDAAQECRIGFQAYVNEDASQGLLSTAAQSHAGYGIVAEDFALAP